MSMLNLDGSQGEGGGQILRTALTLSMCTGQAFRIHSIRAARKKPGLQPQHLVAVHAAAQLASAEVVGAEKDSQELSFTPGKVEPQQYEFDIGTAGSTTLVLQTLLPALLLAKKPSRITLRGGTHNPLAPSFDFLAQAFAPLVERLGPKLQMVLERPGFYPRGGGILHVDIEPCRKLEPLVLLERGPILKQHAIATLSHLPRHIAERELKVLAAGLQLPQEALEIKEVRAYGPGNVLTLIVQSEHVTEVFSSYGQRGLPAENVAEQLLVEAQRYLKAGVPVGGYLADQLLLLLALAGAGAFCTITPSGHTKTNIQIIEQFTGLRYKLEQEQPDVWKVGL